MTEDFLNTAISSSKIYSGTSTSVTNKETEETEETKETKETEETETVENSLTEEDLEDYQAVIQSVNEVLSSIDTSVSSNGTTDYSTYSISELKDEITKLTNNIATYEASITNLDSVLKIKQNELKEKEDKLEELQKEYDEIDKKLKEQEELKSEKERDITNLSTNIKNQRQIIDGMQNNENPDVRKFSNACNLIAEMYSQMNTYLSDKTDIESLITSYSKDLSDKDRDISIAQTSLKSTQSYITGIETQKSALETQKSQAEKELNTVKKEYNSKVAAANNTSGTVSGLSQVLENQEVQYCENMTTADLINLLSAEEQTYVENIDLSEKLCDGTPRYVFATGQNDNKYHVYDMQNNGASLVRQNAPGQGFNIIQSGNGYISNFKEGGRTCYYADDCDEVYSFEACYCTSSPLSLDIDGNGINTTNEIIDYDIDGDGKTDKIYNSADAVLVFDKDGDGISGKDGSECFGDNTDLDGNGEKDGYKNGFEALKALAKENNLIDGKTDNVLDEKDIEFLENEYGFKLKLNGYNSEAVSLKDAGITEINLSQTDETEMIDNFDGLGNQLMKQEGATFKINGETREYADIWHKKLDNDIDNALNVFEGNSLNFNISSNYSEMLLQKAMLSRQNTKQLISNNIQNIQSVMQEVKNIIEDIKKEEENVKDEENNKLE